MSALQGEKYGGHFLKEDASVVKGGDGVLESRRLRVVDYGLNFRIFSLDPFLDGRQKMLVLDKMEGRNIEGRLVRFEKGIVGRRQCLLDGCGGRKKGTAEGDDQAKEKNPGDEMFHGVVKPP